MMTLSGLGDGLPRWSVTVLVCGYLTVKRRYRWAISLAIAMIAAGVLAPALKSLVHTPRHSQHYDGADAFSFPSGHAPFLNQSRPIRAVERYRLADCGGEWEARERACQRNRG